MKTPEQIIEALLECLFVTPHGLPVISAPKELVLAIRDAQAYLGDTEGVTLETPVP